MNIMNQNCDFNTIYIVDEYIIIHKYINNIITFENFGNL